MGFAFKDFVSAEYLVSNIMDLAWINYFHLFRLTFYSDLRIRRSIKFDLHLKTYFGD